MSESTNKGFIFTRESKEEKINSHGLVKVYQYEGCPYVTASVMDKQYKVKNEWKKISSTESVNIQTGEIRTYDVKHNDNRNNNSQSIKRSQQLLVHLIRNNFSNPKFLKLHVVLTFEKTVYDYDVAMECWKNFRCNFKHRFPKAEFIVIVDYYKTGKNKNGIHFHLLLLPNFQAITRHIIQYYWKFGFVYMKEFNSETATYFVKSDIVHLFPKGKKLYSRSKGIVTPKPKMMSFENFIDQMKLENFECSYQKSVDIISKGYEKENEEKVINTITYLKYKKKEVK